jgi:hypothetical protein
MVHFENDYKFGLDQQQKIIPILNHCFTTKLIQYEGQYSKHDYYDDNATYELKSRKVKFNTYPTTLLTANKITSNKKQHLIFIFNFTDKIAIIKYNKKRFNKYEKKMYSRINEEYDEKEYYFIPIEDLLVVHYKNKEDIPKDLIKSITL